MLLRVIVSWTTRAFRSKEEADLYFVERTNTQFEPIGVVTVEDAVVSGWRIAWARFELELRYFHKRHGPVSSGR